jgi:hypothetical protein
MILILNQDCGFNAGGMGRFAVSRWLRLFAPASK